MKETLTLVILISIGCSLFAQTKESDFHISFEDSIATKVKIFTADGESVEIASDTFGQAVCKFTCDCIRRSKICVYYEDAYLWRDGFFYDDTVRIRIVKDDTDQGYLPIVQSTYYVAWILIPGSLQPPWPARRSPL